MTEADLQIKLAELMALPTETEWVEFKEAKSNIDLDDLGRYVSALSNEANLKGQTSGWLVLGVSNKPPRQVVGTSYRLQSPCLEKLKQEIAKQTNHQFTFREIHEIGSGLDRVLLFEIPPAPRGVPITWRQHAYGRIHESLAPLALHEIEEIRRQVPQEDWSAQICPAASLKDLDLQALAFARQEYRQKHPKLADEIEKWDDLTFLNKAKVCVEGQVTRAAIILLGRAESEHFLSPSRAKITWLLKSADGTSLDYRHFGPPFLLAVDQVFERVRNLTCRYLPHGTLFPVEVLQYDDWVMRETLHNCIAHQDYSLCGQINVIESPDSLLFTNPGEFIPGTVEEAIRRNGRAEFYRNRFLTEAMVSLGMIDTIGSGIPRVFQIQRDRNFPMPDYEPTVSANGEELKVRIYGKVLDERYTRMLHARSDLSLWDAIRLDKVQKNKPLSDEEFQPLKAKKLIEGRRPKLFVAAEVAIATDTVEDYLAKRGIDKDWCRKMVLDLLTLRGSATRKQINGLLIPKLSDVLDQSQKHNFVMNLLQEMRKDGLIRKVAGTHGAGSKWELHNSAPNPAT
jgi:ATP-dependent DNA helicase RecG